MSDRPPRPRTPAKLGRPGPPPEGAWCRACLGAVLDRAGRGARLALHDVPSARPSAGRCGRGQAVAARRRGARFTDATFPHLSRKFRPPACAAFCIGWPLLQACTWSRWHGPPSQARPGVGGEFASSAEGAGTSSDEPLILPNMVIDRLLLQSRRQVNGEPTETSGPLGRFKLHDATSPLAVRSDGMPGAARCRQRTEAAAALPHETPPRVAPPNTGTPEIPPEVIAQPIAMQRCRADGNLSDKLSRQQGILQPPAVDPGIHAPMPPDTKATMPVISPPGSPGGNSRVVPK